MMLTHIFHKVKNILRKKLIRIIKIYTFNAYTYNYCKHNMFYIPACLCYYCIETYIPLAPVLMAYLVKSCKSSGIAGGCWFYYRSHYIFLFLKCLCQDVDVGRGELSSHFTLTTYIITFSPTPSLPLPETIQYVQQLKSGKNS